MATFSLKLLGAKVTPTTPMIPGEAPGEGLGANALSFFFFLLFPSHSPPQEVRDGRGANRRPGRRKRLRGTDPGARSAGG